MSDTQFSRTVNIYIDSGQAQAAYDVLVAKQDGLTKKIAEFQAQGRSTTALETQLKNIAEQTKRAADKVSGVLSPSLKDLSGSYAKVSAEIARMSQQDAGFNDKVNQAKKLKETIDQYNTSLGRTKSAVNEAKGAHEGFGAEATKIAAGLGIATTAGAVIEKGIDTVKEAVLDSINVEDIHSRLQNSLQGVDRMDLFPHMIEQAEQLGERFKFVLPSDIKDTEDRLISFGKLSKNQIDELLPVIIDYAAKTRKALPDATQDIIKGFSGLESMQKPLHNLGVELDKNGSFAANYAAIMGQLAPKVKGAADAFEQTNKGALAEWGVWFKEKQKALGDFILTLAGLNKPVLDQVGSLERLRNEMNISFETLKNVNLSHEARAKLLGDINSKYGEYLPHLLTEKSSLDEINAAQTLANKLMLTKILTMSYAKEYNKILEDQKSAIEGAATAEIARAKNATPGAGDKSGLSPAQVESQNKVLQGVENINTKISDNTGKLVDDLKEKYKRMAEVARVSFDEMMKGLDGGPSDNKALDGAYQKFDLTKITGIQEKLQVLNDELKRTTIGSAAFKDLQKQIEETNKLLAAAKGKVKDELAEFEKFQEKIKSLKADIEAKKDGADEGEIQKLRDRFKQLDDEAQKFYDKKLITKKTFHDTEIQIEQLFQEELKALQDKQFGTRGEKEYTAAAATSTKYYDSEKEAVKALYAQQLISKQEYDIKIEQLDSISKHTQITILNDYYDTLKAAYKDDQAKLAKLEDDKVKIQNDAYTQDYNNQLNAIKRKNEAINAQDNTAVIKATTSGDADGLKEARLKQVQDELEQKLQLYKDNEDKINEAEAEAAQKRQQVEAQYLQTLAGDIKKYGSEFTSIMNGIGQIFTNNENHQLAVDKQANNQKKDNLKQQLDHKQISQEQYNKQITALDKQMAAEQDKIAEQQFKRTKALKLASAIINTAAAVVEALASSPPPASYVMAALAGVAGGVQIGVIASEQYTPSHAQGTDSILKGASHQQGGINLWDTKTNRVIGQVEGDESVISGETTRANAPVIQALLAAKGRSISVNSTRSLENIRYAQGGYIGNSTSTASATHNEFTIPTEHLARIADKQDELIGVMKQAQDKKVVFSFNDYNRATNQQSVIFQQGL